MDHKGDEFLGPPITYASDHNHYVMLGPMGSTEGATMYKAKYVEASSSKEIMVGIKAVDPYKVEDIYNLTREITIAKMCTQEKNMVGVYSSFKHKTLLWVVMPLVSRVSLKSIMSSSFPHGLPEPDIAFVLKETLKGLICIHAHDGVHENIGADCLFLDEKSTLKLAFRSLTYEQSLQSRVAFPVSDELPYWMAAPEILMDPTKGHDKKADMWMFGLLALELLYGQVPVTNYNDFKLLVMRIIDRFGLSNKREKKKKMAWSFSPSSSEDVLMKKMSRSCLGEVVALCLSPCPLKRPTASELMDHKFFKEDRYAPTLLRQFHQHAMQVEDKREKITEPLMVKFIRSLSLMKLSHHLQH